MSQVSSVPNLVILGWWEVGPKKLSDAYYDAYAYNEPILMANSWQMELSDNSWQMELSETPGRWSYPTVAVCIIVHWTYYPKSKGGTLWKNFVKFFYFIFEGLKN